MPPKGHSSSSSRSGGPSHHSSSSHSSSSGPSHHSSSSHYSSSGPSSSSYSSHYRSIHSGAHSSSSHNRAGKSSFGSNSGVDPIYLAYVPRQRVNQPQGYRRSKPPKRVYCKNHDYYYYPESWVDNQTGKTYEKGYYDENGEHHSNILLKNERTGKMKFVCQYCGTEVRTEWTEGARPTCPNCSAPLEEEVEEDVMISAPSGEPVKRRKRVDEDLITRIVCFAFLGAIVLGLGIPFVRQMKNETASPQPEPVPVKTSNSIFVEEIGRNCKWLNEYDSYYDPVSDCYFWYNDEIAFPCWQYWYEGISSDFGDYGWMEYDEGEEQWYIEENDSQWIVLPEEYPTEGLWYIHEE